MRTDFAHLLHLFRLLSHHEPPARYFNSYRDFLLLPAAGGWHCSHLYYSWNRAALAQMDRSSRPPVLPQ